MVELLIWILLPEPVLRWDEYIAPPEPASLFDIIELYMFSLEFEYNDMAPPFFAVLFSKKELLV